MRSRPSHTVLALFALLSVPAAAMPSLRPRVVPPKGIYARAQDSVEIPRIVIKFHEGSHVRLRDRELRLLVDQQSGRDVADLAGRGITILQVERDVRTVVRLLGAHQKVQLVKRLLDTAEEHLERQRASGEQISGQALADLNLYFEAVLAPGTLHGEIRDLVAQLDALPSIETAYAESIPVPAATDIAPPTPGLLSEQGYLRAAPLGIDADYAWTKSGGNGANVRIVDVEGAWLTTHEDMPTLFHTGGSQFPSLGWRNHGTAVLGEIVGAANSYGVSGIAHGASAGYESIGSQSPASAIANAARAVGDGGVVLIELHDLGRDDGRPCTCNPGQCKYVAMEFWQANFDVINTATSNGITVVEAAGNGSTDLDHAVYGGLFNRAIRDSGAILVGASSAMDRTPMCWTNFGSRVDVHGWGESVVTMGYGDRFSGGGDENQYYTTAFSGTSSASPIITGAVACIQGAIKGAGRFPLSPVAIRDLLVTTGSPQSPDSRNIGPRPNLRAAFTRLRL